MEVNEYLIEGRSIKVISGEQLFRKGQGRGRSEV